MNISPTDLRGMNQEDSENYVNGLWGGSITCGILGLIFLCCVCCGYKSLRVAIDVIDASADFIAKTKRIILVPILFFFQFLLNLVIIFSALICIASMADINPAKDPAFPQHKTFGWDHDEDLKFKSQIMTGFLLFMLLWIYLII